MDELTTPFRKSSHSGQDGQCVELAGTTDGIAVRDSKNPGGPVLRFSRCEMAGLIERIRTAP
jgi:hypothetical protein